MPKNPEEVVIVATDGSDKSVTLRLPQGEYERLLEDVAQRAHDASELIGD
jgi:hypothetical protein